MTTLRQFRTDDIPLIARQIADMPESVRLDDGALYDRIQVVLLAQSRPLQPPAPPPADDDGLYSRYQQKYGSRGVIG